MDKELREAIIKGVEQNIVVYDSDIQGDEISKRLVRLIREVAGKDMPTVLQLNRLYIPTHVSYSYGPTLYGFNVIRHPFLDEEASKLYEEQGAYFTMNFHSLVVALGPTGDVLLGFCNKVK